MWDKMETPTIVYDLDTSGGLMQQIQALLAPPKSEDGEKRSRKPDKNARRTGRATNHDTCDSCREGGDLLCCDHCPAAFHLQCCNPPLSKEMLPPGDWMCHRCSVRRKKRELKKEHINGLLERSSLQLSKQSPASEQDVSSGPLRLDPAVGPGLRAAVAQVRLLERRPLSRPNTPTSTASTDTPTPSEQNDMDEDMLDVEDETVCSDQESSTPHLKRPFDLLIAAAMERNPTQFQLPNELTCTTALPGSSKRRRRDEMMGKNMKRSQHERDHSGLVPLPVKVCYPCGRSCRLAPLIQCDYCPLLFHMDCLEPPLTAMPVGKWMCPNHIEHLVLKQRSLTLSSRCQLFDQFQDRMSQHAVKVDFLQRVHRLHPPVRRGGHAHLKRTLKVPDSIKSQYRSPPVMIPPAGIRHGELICTGVPEASPSPHPSQRLQPFTCNEEQQEWLRGVITLQCSIMQHLSARHKSSQWEADVKPSVPAGECGAECSSDRTAPGPQGAPAGLKLGSCPSNGPVDQQANGSPEAQFPPASTQSPPASTQSPPASTQSPPASTQSPSPQHPSPSPALPNHLAVVKTEAPPRPCLGPASIRPDPWTPHPPDPLRAPAQTGSTKLGSDGKMGVDVAELSGRAPQPPGPQPPGPQTPGPQPPGPQPPGPQPPGPQTPGPQPPGPQPLSLGDLSSCLKAVTDGHGEIQMGNLDEKFIRLLAWQRVQQLFEPRAWSPQSNYISTSQPAQTQEQQSEAHKAIQARAVFYPLAGTGSAVNMCYRTLHMGTGADMDVCLTNYGHCNYLSGKHACIFYDENTKQYELLNYSEHGTTVDNVLYSCDFSEKIQPSPSSSLVAKVQSIIKRCRRREQQGEATGEAVEATVMSQGPGEAVEALCDCRSSSCSMVGGTGAGWGGAGAGWEGTALLHHGSLIKMGCMQFLFSVTEFACLPPKEENQAALASLHPSPDRGLCQAPRPALSRARVSP
ncbi:PHD finger protein 12-like [Osmerus eperlanus]|uniref:PHD finger protein 12-like n=1 Tax=Osmerus eperlanus TaxID=29151 RepID=UPI002E0E5769